MFIPARSAVLLLLLGLSALTPAARAADPKPSEREAMYHRYLEFASLVKGGSVTPHWMADGSSFWYAEGAPAHTVICKVDPQANTKMPLFDTARLRLALTPVLGHEPPYQGLPFAEFTFVDPSEKAVQFTVEKTDFLLDLDTYTVTRALALSDAEKRRRVPQSIPQPFGWSELEAVMEVPSPDGRWFAGVKENNVWLRSSADGRSVPLTTDGVEDYGWSWNQYVQSPRWSPDSFKLAVLKVDFRQVNKIPIVHWLKPTEEVEWMPYPRPGGPMPQTELFVVDILSRQPVRVDTGKEPDQRITLLGWRPDGPELLLFRSNRRRTKVDLMAANATSGASRVVLTESQNWFIPTGSLFTLLGDGQRFLWAPDREDGQNVSLYDLEGHLIRRLTEGVAGSVVAVDEKAGWVYFTAAGDRERPYDSHLYRVSLEGQGRMRLTEATGPHQIQFAPSRQFFLDTHSTLSRPPVVELRQADGKLLQTLSKANVVALQQLNWSPPEEFVVKSADGKANLHGVLYKPYDYDPNKKYPVIHHKWGAPHSFAGNHGSPQGQALAQLGFVVFRVDTRRSPEAGGERTDRYLDENYRYAVRREIADEVAALQHLAKERPYMDLSRVGIFGISNWADRSLRAMLLAPDVYHVGIIMNPTRGWGQGYEPLMDLPQNNKRGWEEDDTVRLAGNLRGKLLLIHCTSDTPAPLSYTMQMIDGLVQAGKPYDLILLPEQNHYGWSPAITRYWQEAVGRYFQEHLKP
jgi:dipeptidyl aminopeptidase/acylaminoacyl peptidase